MDWETEVGTNILVKVEFALLVSRQRRLVVKVSQVELNSLLTVGQPENLAVHLSRFNCLTYVVH